jgi:O-antigen/teichoic acid export membrane protein
MGVVLLTGALAVAQFYFLPNNLGVGQFGTLILGLSVLQAALQFSDLGSLNASLRSDLPGELRELLRENAVTIASIVCLGGTVVSVAVGLSGRSLGYVAAAAFLCAVLLIGDRANASAAIQIGDEKAATRYNLTWQNAPKLGSIVGSLAHTAVAAMLGAILTSLLCSRPRLPKRFSWNFLRSNCSFWLPGLTVALSGFLLTWTDTYILSFVAGVDEAGQYQAVVRPLTGITYAYLPIVALIQAAHNACARRRVRLLTFGSIGMGVAGSAIISTLLIVLGGKIWPDFRFDPGVVAFAALASSGMCASTVVGTQLVLRGHHLAATVNSTLGAVVLVVVSVLTVEAWGALGAALASASAWLLVAVLHVGFFVWTRRRRVKERVT